MHPMIVSRQAELADACRRFGVNRLEVFGAAARGDFEADTSDFDFVVRFQNPGETGYADRYLEFVLELERILGGAVDLLTERAIRNPVFAEAIRADRTLVYAA